MTVRAFIENCQQTAWRGLMHIAGEQAWAQQCLAAVLAEFPELKPSGVDNNVQLLQRQLGSEVDCLLIDAFQGFNPNMLGMASARLNAGGLLILLSPSLPHWHAYQDPDYQRMLGAIDAELKHQGRFLERAARFLSQCRQAIRLQAASMAEGAEGSYVIAARQLIEPHPPERKFSLPEQAYQEQQYAIEQIKKVARGRAHRSLLISADRGRGKSTALGFACAHLLQEKPITIALTSVSQDSVAQLLFHLAEQLQQAPGAKAYRFNQSCLRFYAIDELLQEKPDCQLLVIDEAAAIPVHLLQRCVQGFKRIVFSTTVKGYEGNGRGFELRFLPFLQRHNSQLKHVRLSKPLRWREDDALEQTVNQLLLLDLDEQTTQVAAWQKPTLSVLQQDELHENEDLLRQFFSLLVNAHYQTSPDDLRMLLDHPQVRPFALRQNEQILAAAIIMQEGQLSLPWLDKLKQGRRPAGHLLPQLFFNQGFEQAARQSYWRIVRIAVQPSLQRQGLGQCLLQAIEQQCQADFLAASFSLSSDVLSFWQAQGFSLCRLGSHKSSATGQFSVLVSKPLSANAQIIQQNLRQQLQADLPVQLLSQNQELDASSAALLFNGLEYACRLEDSWQVERWLEAKLGFEQVFPALRRCLLVSLKGAVNDVSALLVDKVLLNKNWQQLGIEYNLQGRKAIEQAMRHAAKQVFERGEQ